MEPARRFHLPPEYRRVSPFAAAGIICVLLVLAPPAPRLGPSLLAALALTAAIGLAIAVLPRRRAAGWLEALPAFAFLLVVVLVREAGGGVAAGFSTLALLPVIWLALHGSPRQLAAILAAGAAALLAPIWLVGDPTYPLSAWRPALQWLVVGSLVGIAIQRLVREAREHARTVSEQAAALGASERRTRSVLDSLNEIVFQTDPSGRFTFLNQAWSDLTGVDCDEAIGRHLQDFVHPEDRVRNGAAFVALVERQAATFRHEIRLANRDGATRWVEVRGQLTLGDGDRLAGTSGTMTDVTQAREAQALAEHRRLELERSAAALADANRILAGRNRDVEAFAALQRDFVATSSHELRTPLTAILGYLEMVLEADEDTLPDPQRGHVQVAYRSSQRLLALVEDLLTVNRVDTGNLSIAPSPTGVAALLATAHETFAPLYASKGIDLLLEKPPALPVVVDRARMDQVLANLVGNAAKFTPTGGTVRLAARRDGGRVRISVADTGHGIAPDELPRIFDRFFRSVRAQADAVPGTGLGLSIAKALVEAQGGELAVESMPGRGTTFTIILPLAKEEQWLESSSSTTTQTS